MKRTELLNKIDKLIMNSTIKQVMLDNYIDKWLNGEIDMSVDVVQKLIDKVSEQIDKSKKEITKLQNEYMKMIKEEAFKKSTSINIIHNFRITPYEPVIADDILSSNANVSYLVEKNKIPNELEYEKNQLLGIIRERVLKKQMSLKEASNSYKIINLAYSKINSNENTNNKLKK